MNMLELQVLVVVSGVHQSLPGPSLLDAPGLVIELHPNVSPSSTSKSDRQIVKSRTDRALPRI